MIGDLAKRAVNLAIVLLAAVTFFLVPFGRKTLFQHCKAIFTTAPAEELGRELEKKAKDVEHEVTPSGVASHHAGK